MSFARRLRQIFEPPTIMPDILVEDHVVLDGCELFGPTEVGFRSYANHSLLRHVTIGRFCSIGRRCSIGAARHDVEALTTHPAGAPPDFVRDPLPRISNDVWIGDNAIVVSGVSIGDGAVVGGGAVVTRNVAPYAIVAGVPAREIRFRFQAEVRAPLIARAWWRYGDGALVDRTHDIEAALAHIDAAKPAELAAHHRPLRISA